MTLERLSVLAVAVSVLMGCNNQVGGRGGSEPAEAGMEGTGGAAGSMTGKGGAAGSSAGAGGETRDAGGPDGRAIADAGAGGRAPGSDANAATATVNWTTHKFNNARSGWNPSERILTPALVSDGQKFGKLFSHPVDGQIYAQPLVVAGLKVGTKVRNVVFVATETNNVYAFDADDAKETNPLWTVNFGKPALFSDLSALWELEPLFGITGTPVIDDMSGTMYFATLTAEAGGFIWKLHALDIVTGSERTGAPVVISGTVSGNATGSKGGMLTFEPRIHLNRPALLLQAGTVFVAFGSHSDANNYHGWVMGYDARTLKQTGVFVTAANQGHGAAIWMSGNGPVGDGTSVYFATGNGFSGASDPNTVPPQLGEAMVKLDNTLALKDWHIRGNYAALDASDVDYGISGPLLIAKTNELVMGGKDSAILVYDKDNLGKYKPNDTDAVLQKFTGTGTNTLRGNHSGGFIYWEGPNGVVMFAWPAQSKLLGFKLGADKKFDPMPAVVGPEVARSLNGVGSGVMTISSIASQNGILWAALPDTSGNFSATPGTLRAYDPLDGKLLWHSNMNKARDDVGLHAKTCPPTVVNGKVYLGSFTGTMINAGQRPIDSKGVLHVYGLL